MSNISAEKLNIEQNAERGLREIFSKRMAEGKAKWVGTQYPCLSYAQEAEMSLREYEEFVYSATFANQPDPIAAWENIRKNQQKYVDFLKGKKTIYIRGDHADLHLSVDGRTFINEGGEENMPGGEVFTSPVENSANGWIDFTYPAIMHGHEVQGIRLEFKDGKVIKATAEKNEDFLIKMLDVDENARYLGEFAFGTNYGIQRFTKNLLFDEKIGGTIHLALGEGFEDAGGKNMSSIHWDMICDMHHGEILADGEIFYKDGHFVE
jgi:aminopeptidase